MDNYMVMVIVAVVSIFCFFMVRKKIENEKRKKLEEERRVAEQERPDRAKQLEDEISRLQSLVIELSRNYNTPSSSEEENRKYRECKDRIIELEKELYELTGQPTSFMVSSGIAGTMREAWNKKHNVQSPAPKAEKKPKVDPVLAGVSAALLTNAIAEKDRKEREHQKEIKELKDEIRKLRGR